MYKFITESDPCYRLNHWQYRTKGKFSLLSTGHTDPLIKISVLTLLAKRKANHWSLNWLQKAWQSVFNSKNLLISTSFFCQNFKIEHQRSTTTVQHTNQFLWYVAIFRLLHKIWISFVHNPSINSKIVSRLGTKVKLWIKLFCIQKAWIWWRARIAPHILLDMGGD